MYNASVNEVQLGSHCIVNIASMFTFCVFIGWHMLTGVSHRQCIKKNRHKSHALCCLYP